MESRGHASGGGVWGRRKSSTKQKRLNRCQSSRVIFLRRSILARHHYGNGGLRVVHVEEATHGNQFDKARGAVVVANVERKRQAGLSGLCLEDGKAEHPDNIPKPSGFVLAGYVGRHGHVSVEHATCEKLRKAD